MAYVASHRRRMGLGLFDDLNPKATARAVATDYSNQLKAQGQNVVDASKQEAVAFAQAQLATYPTAGAVAAQYDEYVGYLKQIPGFNPADMGDPSKCVKLMQQALIIYARQNGIPTNTPEAAKALESYALSVASSQTGIPLPTELPTSVADLKRVAVNFACTTVLMQTGVDPKIATVTVECLLDGKLSGEDCTQIGTCAGSIAGAEVAMSFGIPAPIGSFIGGLAGGMIGGTVAEILGLSDPQDFVRKLQQQERDLEKAVLDQAQAICSGTRSMYWDAFDALLYGTELQWRTMEEKIGWRFPLRWFGMQYDNAAQPAPFLRAYDPRSGNYTGALTTATRAEVLAKNINYDVYSTDGTLKSTPLYGCKLSYGCPYPQSGAFTSSGPLARDAEAFFARGAQWIPPGPGRPTQCVFPIPSGVEAFDESVRCAWLQRVRDVVQAESAALASLQILSVSVIGDLVKTAAAVAAEKSMYDTLKQSQTQISMNGIKRSQNLAAAKRTGVQLSDFLNYGMLLAGVGVLGAALYKRSQGSGS